VVECPRPQACPIFPTGVLLLALLVAAVGQLWIPPKASELTDAGTPPPPAVRMRWILDGPVYRNQREVRVSSDQLATVRIGRMLAAAPERLLLGGDSDLPVQLWLVHRRDDGGQSGLDPRTLVLAVADPRFIPAAETLSGGQRHRLGLRCGGRLFLGEPVCTPIGGTRSLRQAPTS
jgi:hypothetical protein